MFEPQQVIMHDIVQNGLNHIIKETNGIAGCLMAPRQMELHSKVAQAQVGVEQRSSPSGEKGIRRPVRRRVLSYELGDKSSILTGIAMIAAARNSAIHGARSARWGDGEGWEHSEASLREPVPASSRDGAVGSQPGFTSRRVGSSSRPHDVTLTPALSRRDDGVNPTTCLPQVHSEQPN